MLVTMSDKEISRINVIQSVVEKRMRRRDAAHQLALTERQTQRLMNRFREFGATGLANLRRGCPVTVVRTFFPRSTPVRPIAFISRATEHLATLKPLVRWKTVPYIPGLKAEVLRHIG